MLKLFTLLVGIEQAGWELFANFGILYPFRLFAVEVTRPADGAAFPERGAVKAVVATSETGAESAATGACSRQLAAEYRDFLADLEIKVGRVPTEASATSAESCGWTGGCSWRGEAQARRPGYTELLISWKEARSIWQHCRLESRLSPWSLTYC